MSHFDTDSLSADQLPKPGTRWCEYEKKALEIRRLAGCRDRQPLDPYYLASILRFNVMTLSQLPADDPSVNTARETVFASNQWSGAAIIHPSDHSVIIVLNDRHSPRRLRATLMEEICHVILGHPPTRIFNDGVRFRRSYQRDVEDEAYSVGAAALTPYKSLHEMLHEACSIRQIAQWFGVSAALVNYRFRVLGLSQQNHTHAT